MSGIRPQLVLDRLHERHSGLTAALGQALVEAAAVCLDRHHTSPVEIRISSTSGTNARLVEFPKPDQRILNAWANEIDTTENGAYGLSLPAVEAEERLVAVRRAETLTGADWYVAPIGVPLDDLEDCYWLEVSGIAGGGRAAIETRLQQKIAQTKRGASNLPSIASVVGFKERVILIQRVT